MNHISRLDKCIHTNNHMYESKWCTWSRRAFFYHLKILRYVIRICLYLVFTCSLESDLYTTHWTVIEKIVRGVDKLTCTHISCCVITKVYSTAFGQTSGLFYSSDTVLQEDAVNTLYRLNPTRTYHISDLPKLRKSMLRCIDKYIYGEKK